MANKKEMTFVMVKPDGVQRSLIGEIISLSGNQKSAAAGNFKCPAFDLRPARSQHRPDIIRPAPRRIYF